MLIVKTLVAARPVAATYARVTVTATTSAQGISSASSDLTLNRCRAALAVADEVSIAMHYLFGRLWMLYVSPQLTHLDCFVSPLMLLQGGTTAILMVAMNRLVRATAVTEEAAMS